MELTARRQRLQTGLCWSSWWPSTALSPHWYPSLWVQLSHTLRSQHASTISLAHPLRWPAVPASC